MTNGQKYTWAGRIAVACLAGMTVITGVSMFHWPVEPDVLRSTNATFAAVLTFVLGVFTGASSPDPKAVTEATASLTSTKSGGATLSVGSSSEPTPS